MRASAIGNKSGVRSIVYSGILSSVRVIVVVELTDHVSGAVTDIPWPSNSQAIAVGEAGVDDPPL